MFYFYGGEGLAVGTRNEKKKNHFPFLTDNEMFIQTFIIKNFLFFGVINLFIIYFLHNILWLCPHFRLFCFLCSTASQTFPIHIIFLLVHQLNFTLLFRGAETCV